MGATITIENALKRYGNDTIINGLSLEVQPGEFFTLLGPSGCGKTTLLRMIIGFNSIEGGIFKINNRVINDIPTNKRNIGMVFQNYAVFPHMSVFDNVAFGLKNRKLPKEEIQKKVDAILKVVKIDHFQLHIAAVVPYIRIVPIRQRVDAFFSVPVAQFKDFPVLSIIKRHDEVLLPWKSDFKFIARSGTFHTLIFPHAERNHRLALMFTAFFL